ncbi:MAG TPA: FG-GAP-like repeat-containing protein [Luteitalea sp.]|nr:FG-GAP-like repeat-containing protein [Luteitalea sp.]
MRMRTYSGIMLALVVAAATHLAAQHPLVVPSGRTYQPTLAPAEGLEPFFAQLEAGHDAFPRERDAQEIESRLAALGRWLKTGGTSALPIVASDFRGVPVARATPAPTDGPLAITRVPETPDTPGTIDGRAFAADLRRWLGDARSLLVTEFLVTAVSPGPDAATRHTDVRYDIVATVGKTGREEVVGTWRITWRKDAAGWNAVAWRDLGHVRSRASTPLFTEVSDDLLGGITSFRQQLSVPLDAWNATLDAVLTRDSNGHHGVSVGDADGDGRDDLYVAQSSGLPNRLYRALADGTFEDVTDAAGVGLLDDTAQSIFADIDNDGDQDLVLATSQQPVLFRNVGKGRFEKVGDAFAFTHPLQGMLTGLAVADYDRDGLLDVYLCVYSYFFGAGDDKAGTPMPYHDARNGPPGVLFRNAGGGRFVDVTDAVGLATGNDRYHFAASWADFDEDGWPDLLVANDFGTKNLYRNLGAAGGSVRFEDVAGRAGVLDHGAGMSAAFLDYDNDGRLDIYTGNMWTAPGQRITADPAFLPEAPADVRGLYRRHTRGNSLLRNKGDGTFEDTTMAAGVAMGRWAWSSDAIDIDSDGWQDLYVANGMLSRGDRDVDLESYFWRQVVARSPLTPVKGTPYDEAWRAINQRLVHGSIASRQRNVLFRNDGRGHFDEVSGALGLDLDQDGRSFGMLDVDRDGDPDLVLMAARQSPQLRVFRNDHPPRAVIAIRLTGTGRSNRDAIGARVTVDTGDRRIVRVVQTASGFLSQHSREVIVGLGDSTQVRALTVEWPSGERQQFGGVKADTRYTLTEGGDLTGTPIDRRPPSAGARASDDVAHGPGLTTWFVEPVPVPDFIATDLGGTVQSRASLAGRPAVLLFWHSDVPQARAALTTLANGVSALSKAGIGALAVALDEGPSAEAAVKSAAPPGLPVVLASREFGLRWALVHRHLFMNKQAMPLPTTLLLDPQGRVVRAYRLAPDAATIVRDVASIDATPETRLARALPFPGVFHVAPSPRNELGFGKELLEQGLDADAIAAFERASARAPSPAVLYQLGSLLMRGGETQRARTAFERALAIEPTLAEAHNDLGTMQAQAGDLPGAIARFQQALQATPDYPDALNNLGYALLLSGREAEARPLYEKALALQPDFPEALNNLGLLLGRSGDLARAETYFRDALARRPTYGEAANNLALVLVGQGRAADAVTILEALLTRAPDNELAYLTLARIHLQAGRTAEGVSALERLLQRNPTHPQAQALLREFGPKR